MITARDIISKSKFFKLEDLKNVDIDKTHYRIWEILEVYRQFIGCKLIIDPRPGAVNAELGDGLHNDKSYHYIIPGRNVFSLAIDLFPCTSLYEAFFLATRFSFGGIGVYPYEELLSEGIVKTDTTKGMLHLDLHSHTNFRVQWWVDENKKYHYINNINDYEVLLKIIKPD
ncbi:MAG: hypothetical protein H7836_12390 [Magnetococcus sp. YQC-3]